MADVNPHYSDRPVMSDRMLLCCRELLVCVCVFVKLSAAKELLVIVFYRANKKFHR